MRHLSSVVAVASALAAPFLAHALAPSAQEREAPDRPAASSPKVEPYRLSVLRTPTVPGLELFEDARVEVKVAVHAPGKPLLSVVDEACVVRSFTDDRGTDLAAGLDTGFFHWVQMDSRWGEDASQESASLTITTSALPAREAGRLSFDGTVVLLSASDLREDTARVTFTVGTELELGGVKFTVSQVSDEAWGDSVQLITLDTNTELDAFQGFELLDEEGRPVATSDLGTSTMRFGKRLTVSKQLGSAVELERGAVRATYYAALEQVEVPLRFSLGVGL